MLSLLNQVALPPNGVRSRQRILSRPRVSGAYAEAANKAADGMAEMYSGDRLSQPSLSLLKTVLKAVTATPTENAIRSQGLWLAQFNLSAGDVLSDRMFDRIILRTAGIKPQTEVVHIIRD